MIFGANANGTGSTGNSTSYMVYIVTTSISHVATMTLDATNITLNFTSSGSG